MEAKLSPNAKKVIMNSRDEAIRLSSENVGIEHIFLGMMREKQCSAMMCLSKLNVDLFTIKSGIENTIRNTDSEIHYRQEIGRAHV